MRWSRHRLAFAIAAGVLAVWVVAMGITVRLSALPPQASGLMLAVFDPTIGSEVAYGRIAAAGGRPVRQLWLPFVWVAAGDEPGFAGRLVQSGAIGAYAELPIPVQLAGCFAFADAKVAEIFALRP
jgi:hypothetical protein